MFYVTSDIHGEFDKFSALLDKIAFSDKDTLFVLGDVVDRGPKPLEALSYIKDHGNIICLKGNHEGMALRAVEGFTREDFSSYPSFTGLAPEKEDYLRFWLRHGGNTTLRDLCTAEEDKREALLSYMESLPLYKMLDMGEDKTAILVHAGLGNYHKDKPICDYTEEELTFCRPFLHREYYNDKVTVIVGHTPTLIISGYPRIFTSENMKFIDCGCAFGGALACLRLDDMAEFYVE